MRDAASQCIARGCHNPSFGDISVHPSVTSQWAILAHGTRPSSAAAPAQPSGVTAASLPTPSPHLFSCARHRCFTPVTEASAGSSQGPVGSLWPRQTSPGTYGQRVHSLNTSCLPWRLQDKVPQALPTAQHCWPALWAPLLLPTGHPRQRLARSGRSSPIFLP